MAGQHSLLDSTFPVLLPDIPELRFGKDEFDTYIRTLLPARSVHASGGGKPSTTDTKVPPEPQASSANSASLFTKTVKTAPFMTALLSEKSNVPSFDSADGKMLTENGDVAYRTSGQALVGLFYELEEVVSAARLRELLNSAWTEDPETCLKLIWNARSIHLGKSARKVFYRALGWLAQNHPRTLVANLPWLVRPLIEKKKSKPDPKNESTDNKEEPHMVDAEDADSDFEMVDADVESKQDVQAVRQLNKLKIEDNDKYSEFDIKYGVSHGYWKDLLNILALAANDQLKVDGDPKTVLNVGKAKIKPYRRDWTPGADRRKAINIERHERVVEKLKTDKLYRALHLTVARLFADQLKLDISRLDTGNKADIKRISLAAKWAPTHKGMHDQHTCIVSSIAELLHPFDTACPESVDPSDRESYLKYARIAYQSKTLSRLRKHLQVVERDITAGNFAAIEYERVPSLAMHQYTPLFAKKDEDRFDQYIEKVATGKKTISGAVMLPSTLVAAVSSEHIGNAKKMVEKKLLEMRRKVVDAQWNTLVQRIKDSGTLESSIGVADVSGSMSFPTFADGTCPMSSSVGLSLLLAEVTAPPFGGAIITFSAHPEVVRVGGKDDKRTFTEKVRHIMQSHWGTNTNFTAVFTKLILPMAIENKLAPEDMVKTVFVFSDMQFDQANHGLGWQSSYEWIKEKFKEAGYEMPKLVFWNLAGGRAGYDQTSLSRWGAGDDTAPKPVTAAEEGTALVSGYSQGMLKVFLDRGGFDEPEDEEEKIVEKEDEDGEVVVEKQAKEKKKQDPAAVMRKAVSHDAYRMLRVVD